MEIVDLISDLMLKIGDYVYSKSGLTEWLYVVIEVMVDKPNPYRGKIIWVKDKHHSRIFPVVGREATFRMDSSRINHRKLENLDELMVEAL